LTSPELSPGLVIGGRYELVRRLGAGGFGSVWLCRDRQARGVDRPVAIKIMHAELAIIRGRDFQRFQREAEVLSKLDHPAIARALGYELDGDHAFIVMEHVDGLPLDRVLTQVSRQGSTIDAVDASRIFDDLAGAIGYAHSLGIVHRDLKPQNVMVVRRADRVFVKVLDFGIARVAGEAEDAGTTLGRMIGSYHYMAPEQIRGERVDSRVDIFALGTMLFELVTSRRAWARDLDGQHLPAHLPTSANALGDIMERILTGPRPQPSLLREGLPVAFDAVVARATAPARDDRYSTAAELGAAASALLLARPKGRGLSIVQIEPEVRTALKELPAILEPVILPPPLPASTGDRTPVADATAIRTMPLVARPMARPMASRWVGRVAGGVVMMGIVLWAIVMRQPVVELPVEPAPTVVPSPEPVAAVGAVPAPVTVEVVETSTPSLSPSAAVRPLRAPRVTPAVVVPDAGESPPRRVRPMDPLIAAAMRPGADFGALSALADAIRAVVHRGPPADRSRILRKVEDSLLERDAAALAGLAEQLGGP